MIVSHKVRLLLNSASSLVLQIVSLICGFILPHLILNAYGSEVNGLISSITQFLTVISLCDFGVTAVVQSALYKPLANNDRDQISRVYAASKKYFRTLGLFLIAYTLVLCIIYPIVVDNEFSFSYVSTLILILSINSIAQYMLGITNSQIISSDQRQYVLAISQIITTIINTATCYIEIKMGASIHFVKLSTSIIFLLRPFVAELYIRKNYKIDRKISYSEDPIKQKWSGLAQHISSYIFNCTDVVILSLFSTLIYASIYSVYVLVLNGIRNLCNLLDNGIKPLLGEFWAKEDMHSVRRCFCSYDWLIHAMSVFVFGCCSNLIVPFIQVYTIGVNDTNYIKPLFALIITMAYMVMVIRSPYHVMIQAAGHYQQTKLSYLIPSAINIILSVILVINYGLVGVAIGTFIAALVQTVWQALYVYNKILLLGTKIIVKLLLVDSLVFIATNIICTPLVHECSTYFSWVILAIQIAPIWAISVVLINIIFFRKELSYAKSYFLRRKAKQ